MDYQSDSDTNHSWNLWNNPEESGKETEVSEDRKKN